MLHTKYVSYIYIYILPGAWPVEPRGLIGRIYVGTIKLYHILNISAVGFMVSEKNIFKVLTIISLWELMTPGSWQVWPPRA